MSIRFSCTSCSSSYTVKDELAGKKARCKKCGKVVVIPQVEADDDLDPPDIAFLDEVAVAQAGSASLESDFPPAAVYRDSQTNTPPAMGQMPMRTAPEPFAQQSRRFTSIRDARPVAGAANPKAGRSAVKVAAAGSDPELESNAAKASIGMVILVAMIAIVFVIASGKASDGTAWFAAIAIAIVALVLLFGIAAPATMGGVWITCKMFGHGVPPRLYVRSVGAILTVYFTAFLINLGVGVIVGLLGFAGIPQIIASALALLAQLAVLYVWVRVYDKYFNLGTGGTICAALFSVLLISLIYVPIVLIALSRS